MAFVTQHDPLHVRAGRFWDPSGTLRMKSPLEVIALDNDGTGDFPIAPPLKLGSDVNEKRPALVGEARVEFGNSEHHLVIIRSRDDDRVVEFTPA
jgi:hypothetical protein